MTTSVRLSCDSAAFEAMTAELLSALPQPSPELLFEINRLLDVGELFSIETDDLSAPGASELVVRIKPSDGFLRFVAAARAGKGDLVTLNECFGHGFSSAGGCGDASEVQAPAESQGLAGACAGKTQGAAQ